MTQPTPITMSTTRIEVPLCVRIAASAHVPAADRHCRLGELPRRLRLRPLILMFSGMTGVVCLPLNQGQVASAGSVTIRTALQCRSVPMISSSRRVVVRSNLTCDTLVRNDLDAADAVETLGRSSCRGL
jgi:hypothetical protein